MASLTIMQQIYYMASVTYGKRIMAILIMAIVFMAKVLWQMLLSLDVQLYKNEYIDKMTNLKIYFTTRMLSSFINSCFVCYKT